MLNFCDIVVAILKMATSRNCSMSGINSGHHNLPTCEMALKLGYVNLCGHFKMATARNFSMSGINSGHFIYPHIKIGMFIFEIGL